ncbi:hypothetical protein H2248_005024, partial [Termitomyces sp. 'cryptogamus']
MPYFSTGDPSTWVLNPKKLCVSPLTATPHLNPTIPTNLMPEVQYQASLLDFLTVGLNSSPPSIPPQSDPTENPEQLCIWQQNIHKSATTQAAMINL